MPPSLIYDLQLVYNKARQAAITRELSEIVGGAAAVAIMIKRKIIDEQSDVGKIVRNYWCGVDVEFPRKAVPKIYDALIVDNLDLTLEVQQQLGMVLCALLPWESSEGLDEAVNCYQYRPPYYGACG